MSEKTWGQVHDEEVERQLDHLRRARDKGQTWLVVTGVGQVDPTRMPEDKMRAVARRAADTITEHAINIRLESRRQKGQRLGDSAPQEIWTSAGVKAARPENQRGQLSEAP